MIIKGWKIQITMAIVPSRRKWDKVRRTSRKAQNPEVSGKEISHKVEELDTVVAEKEKHLGRTQQGVPKEKQRYS